MSDDGSVWGEMDVSAIGELEGGAEFLRMWKIRDGGTVCLIEPRALTPDPFAFGLAAMDAIRHAARAWARVVDASEEDVLARILEGFDAERERPTTDLMETAKPH